MDYFEFKPLAGFKFYRERNHLAAMLRTLISALEKQGAFEKALSETVEAEAGISADEIAAWWQEQKNNEERHLKEQQRHEEKQKQQKAILDRLTPEECELLGFKRQPIDFC